MSAAKKQKKGIILAIAMVIIYVTVLVGTLNYTGVIKLPALKKANVAQKKADKKTKRGSVAKSAKAAEAKTGASTTTTTAPTTTTTIVAPVTSQQGDEGLQRLVKMYEAMDSDQAAKIIAKLSDDDAVTILGKMKTANAAEVLASMDSQRAADLSKRLGLLTQ